MCAWLTAVCLQIDAAVAQSSNANAVEPLTPTASALNISSTILPASRFVQPVASVSDPLFAASLLAPWPLVRVVSKRDMNAIVAVGALAKGSRIAKFYGEVQTTPTMYTLQISDAVHVTCSEGGPTYTNHSCDPNAFFDMTHCTAEAPFPLLTALRDIKEGEEISFNYCQNEWAMAVPFFCLCGAPNCLGKIEGFSKLDIDTKKAFQPYLSPFIARKWREQEAEAQASPPAAATAAQ